jgi:hypothetical protein
LCYGWRQGEMKMAMKAVAMIEKDDGANGVSID